MAIFNLENVRNGFAILDNPQNHSNIVQIGQSVIHTGEYVNMHIMQMIVLIMQIAQHMEVSIRQFLHAGDTYSTFLW